MLIILYSVNRLDIERTEETFRCPHPTSEIRPRLHICHLFVLRPKSKLMEFSVVDVEQFKTHAERLFNDLEQHHIHDD